MNVLDSRFRINLFVPESSLMPFSAYLSDSLSHMLNPQKVNSRNQFSQITEKLNVFRIDPLFSQLYLPS